MRSVLFALVLSSVLSILGCTSARADTEPARDRIAGASAARLSSMTVAIVKSNGTGGVYPLCAGVWVSSRTILTARHCIDTPVVPYVTREDVHPKGALTVAEHMTVRGAIVYAVDDEHDLALLRAVAPPAGHAIAHVRPSEVLQGMRVQTIGHPYKHWYSYASGDVAAIREFDLEGEGNVVLWVQATAPTSPGCSGGGLFDADGALVGIVDAVSSEGQQLNFFVHPSYIEGLIGEASRRGLL